ncbi:unnamed protein product [Paramecium octaurelia]|uniref:Transmembrane protein n=1 Tax=Paramecium octaurelia TaxID=43137 RepID=A0A8S1YN21_PAROT|nr:unnamed protein product [Paramecium octaurelia]
MKDPIIIYQARHRKTEYVCEKCYIELEKKQPNKQNFRKQFTLRTHSNHLHIYSQSSIYLIIEQSCQLELKITMIKLSIIFLLISKQRFPIFKIHYRQITKNQNTASYFLSLRQNYQLEKVFKTNLQIIKVDLLRYIEVNLGRFQQSLNSRIKLSFSISIYKILQKIIVKNWINLQLIIWIKYSNNSKCQIKEINLYKNLQRMVQILLNQLIRFGKQINLIKDYSYHLIQIEQMFNSVYVSIRDELNGKQLWNKIMVYQVFKSQSGNIIGGFSTSKWQYQMSSYIKKGWNIMLFIVTYLLDFEVVMILLLLQTQIWLFQIRNNIITHLFGQSIPNIVECEIRGFKFD